MSGPRRQLSFVGALLPVLTCLWAGTNANAAPTFGDDPVYIYYDYTADGFLEINGVELTEKKIVISYPNQNVPGKSVVTMTLSALKAKTIKSTTTEVETSENVKGEIKKKTTREETITESVPLDEKGIAIPDKIVVKDIDYDGTFSIAGTKFADFQGQLQNIIGPRFRFSTRPAPDIFISATVTPVGNKPIDVEKKLVLRLVHRKKAPVVVCCQKALSGLKWAPPQVVVNYEFDKQGLFTTKGPELNPMQLTITAPAGLVLDNPTLDITMTASDGGNFGGDGKISVKKLTLKDAKIVIGGDDFKTMFAQMTDKFKATFTKQNGLAKDVIVTGMVSSADGSKALDVDGILVIRMVPLKN